MDTVRDLKPPFCRQGNKYPIRDVIIPLIPPHKRYVELFAGSGAIFWNKHKAEENILNDLDKQVVSQYHLLKKAPLDPDKYELHLDTIPKVKAFFNKTPRTTADKLLWEKIRTSNGFSGKPVVTVDNIYRPSNPANVLDNLVEYKDMLEGVKIENRDYADIVKKYDGRNTFFFIDPPYENTSKSFGYAQDTDFDFERLRQILASIKGDFLMTINDSPRIRTLFKEFNIKPFNVYTAWGHREGRSTTRKELLISNYTLHRRK